MKQKIEYFKTLGFNDLLVTPDRICGRKKEVMPHNTSYKEVSLNFIIKRGTLTIYRDEKIIYKGAEPPLDFWTYLLGCLTYKI